MPGYKSHWSPDLVFQLLNKAKNLKRMLDVHFQTRKRREGDGKEENIREQLKWNESNEER